MGNNVTRLEHGDAHISSVMQMDFPILDIGKKVGMTGYIDFINYTDVTSPVMKGTDIYGRSFFVVRAKMTKKDSTCVDTLETFFQRRVSGDLWHGCGHDGPYFMSTEGGMAIEQMTFIKNLLVQGKVELTEDIIENLRIGYNFDDRTDFVSIELA